MLCKYHPNIPKYCRVAQIVSVSKDRERDLQRLSNLFLSLDRYVTAVLESLVVNRRRTCELEKLLVKSAHELLAKASREHASDCYQTELCNLLGPRSDALTPASSDDCLSA